MTSNLRIKKPAAALYQHGRSKFHPTFAMRVFDRKDNDVPIGSNIRFDPSELKGRALLVLYVIAGPGGDGRMVMDSRMDRDALPGMAT